MKQFNLPFCAVNVEHPLFQRLVNKGILFDSAVMEMHKIFLEVGRSPNPKEYMSGIMNMEKFPVIPPKGCDPKVERGLPDYYSPAMDHLDYTKSGHKILGLQMNLATDTSVSYTHLRAHETDS